MRPASTSVRVIGDPLVILVSDISPLLSSYDSLIYLFHLGIVLSCSIMMLPSLSSMQVVTHRTLLSAINFSSLCMYLGWLVCRFELFNPFTLFSEHSFFYQLTFTSDFLFYLRNNFIQIKNLQNKYNVGIIDIMIKMRNIYIYIYMYINTDIHI